MSENKILIERFSAIANDYCTLLENVNNFPKQLFIPKVREILAGLYYFGLILPEMSSEEDLYAEQHITEEIWDSMNYNLENKFGQHNAYQEVYDEDYKLLEEPANRSVAEDLTDIYQDLKNYTKNYTIGNEELIVIALLETKNNFETHWGQTSVNVLRALHNLIEGEENINDDANEIQAEFDEDKINQWDTKNWLINDRFTEEEEGDNQHEQ